jgi:hypothetical protein
MPGAAGDLTELPMPTGDPTVSVAAAGPAGLDVLYDTATWSDDLVRDSGVRVVDVPFVTIGGGLASFAVVDLLRICGVPVEEIRVLSPQRNPYDNVRRLMRSSQVLADDPLRSDSMSRVDNVWGFPGYAAEQALAQHSLRPLLRVLAEPLAAEYFNPSPRQVFDGMDREAKRIEWQSMLVQGRATLVRKRTDGGYFCLVEPVDGGGTFALCSRYVHIGTGYPALNFAPELCDYRARYGEYFRVVNAYEPHEQLYQVLRRRQATVLLRGAGITASRVLERLLDDQAKSGQRIRIMHLFRAHDDELGAAAPRRPRRGGWSHQPFSFPKAAAAGQLRRPMLGMDDTRRAEYIRALGGTTSPHRNRWEEQLRRAQARGLYQEYRGEVRELSPSARGGVEVRVDVHTLPDNTKLDVDFVVDCTGLRFTLGESPLLADLLRTAGVGGNPLGGLDVGRHFELRGTDGDSGRIYASGVVAQGGYLAPVDSFWGFTHAALLICDDLARQGFCPRLGVSRSVAGWFRWLNGAAP